MKKSKKSRGQPRDRLSDLPDSLIFEIFWLLPMRDVIRTTILSKRWNNLWKTTPYLNFDSDHSLRFINRALMLWKGLKILKFKIVPEYDADADKSAFSDIDVWVSLARENGVEEFYLEDTQVSYCVPQSLFSCSSLIVLSLKYCKLQIDGNVHLNQLEILMIEECSYDEHFIDKVVSGSPQLEVFILNLMNSDYDYSIRSTSLKELTIRRDLDFGPPRVSELRIWSPNLETLNIEGMPYGKCLLMDISSVTHLTLDISYDIGHEEEEQKEDADIYGKMLWRIFPTIQHVENLMLSDWCIEVLGATKDKYSTSPSSNLKSLTINKYCHGGYERMVDFLQIFPKMKTLVLISNPFYSQILVNHTTSFLQIERNLPESFLRQLRTVEITLTKLDNLVFPFIEILLKYASKLQKMVFRVEKINRSSTLLLLARKLLRMPRSSPSAELIFEE